MTKQIMVGGVPVGGGAPVTIQSMTNTRTDDVEATLRQIRALAAAGCEIVRVAVPDMAAAQAVGKIKEAVPHPPGGGHPLRLQAGPGGHRRRGGQGAHQPGQHRGRGPREGGGPGLRPAGGTHPHRGQRRLFGEAPAGQVRGRLPRGHGGVRLRPHPAAEPVRL